MSSNDLTYTLSVEQSPDEVFAAINAVPQWWSGQIEGVTDRVGGEFLYRYADKHESRQRVTELVPGRRVVWRVTESRLSFLEHQSEWTGTDIVFEITPQGGRTEVRFTHTGLTPAAECYDACSRGWGKLITENLNRLIATGARQPDAFARA